jgi:signal transduction histidine kinase
LVHVLEQLAGLLLLTILLVASLRSYHRRKDLRLQAQKLLASQRELDSARNTLIKNSLANLQPALGELKARFRNLRLGSPQAKPALDGIAQLDSLLGKFTIAASLEAGAMTKAAQPLELNQLVGNSIGRYTNAIQSKFLSVKNEVEPASLNQDPLLLSFVIDSLLSNAIKYSPNHGEIRIGGKLTGHGVELGVEDHGPGIDQAKQAQLFEPFSRAENTAADFNTQGVGLSLYLDKLVMGYLGGEIDLDSQAGKGTRVSLSL